MALHVHVHAECAYNKAAAGFETAQQSLQILTMVL